MRCCIRGVCSTLQHADCGHQMMCRHNSQHPDLGVLASLRFRQPPVVGGATCTCTCDMVCTRTSELPALNSSYPEACNPLSSCSASLMWLLTWEASALGHAFCVHDMHGQA